MDVVDLTGVVLEPAVQEALQGANGQLASGLVQIHGAGAVADVPGHGEALRGAPGLQIRQKLLRVGFHDDPVDGFKDLGLVVDVLQLHQGIAGRVIAEILAGMGGLQLLVAGFGRGQGVVAVAHGEHHGHPGQALVFLADVGGIVRQTGLEGVHGLPLHQPAGNMAAALHEIEVIELGQAVLLGGDGLQQNLVVVVAEHQNVGQLHGSIPANPHSRRNALHHGLLRGADGGHGTHGKIIGVQIHHAHQALADGAALQRALHIDEGPGIGLEHAGFLISGHGFVDQGRVGSFLGGAQLRLGQDQVDGGRRVPRRLPHPVPIGRLGRKLVAGDDRPFFHGIHLGHQNISGQECVHGQFPFQNVRFSQTAGPSDLFPCPHRGLFPRFPRYRTGRRTGAGCCHRSCKVPDPHRGSGRT